MPLPKGRTNNPHGRPKGSTNNNPLRDLCRNATPESFKRIVELAKLAEEESVRLKANTWICEQAYGKARESVEIEGDAMGGALQAVLQIVTREKAE